MRVQCPEPRGTARPLCVPPRRSARASPEPVRGPGHAISDDPSETRLGSAPVTASKPAPLAGLRVVECSMLGPAAVTSSLADLGAEVIKVEPPSGDYVRGMTWPIVEGVSLLHLHVNRAKKGIVLDLR